MDILYVQLANELTTPSLTARTRLKRRLGFWVRLAAKLDMVRKKFGEILIITAYSEQKERLKSQRKVGKNEY